MESTGNKGRIFNIQKFSVHDGPGVRDTVFMKGCPLHCIWCSNPESQSPLPQIGWRAKKCIGCGGCLSCCEMRAIRLADGAKGALDAEITARHDENPLPELGKPVDVFNAFGEKISGGRVTQALAGSNAGRAATIRFRLPREFLSDGCFAHAVREG